MKSATPAAAQVEAETTSMPSRGPDPATARAPAADDTTHPISPDRPTQLQITPHVAIEARTCEYRSAETTERRRDLGTGSESWFIEFHPSDT